MSCSLHTSHEKFPQTHVLDNLCSTKLETALQKAAKLQIHVTNTNSLHGYYYKSSHSCSNSRIYTTQHYL